ncbi:MAG: SUMF1/EgtB/PvdO family nonheme iron enzyme [Cyanobacteria bacterium P01_D01_bin.2]
MIRRRYGISEQLLQQLVASRLIRSEPLAEGGYAYELSHDTLVPPILEAKKECVRARERRRWAIGAVLGGLAIVGLAFFAIWVNGLRLDAEAAQREAEQSDSLAQVRLRQALYSDSIAQSNLKRAFYSDSVANRRAQDAEQARTETQRQLTALQESNRRRVTELMGRFPDLINELRFEEAADLVLQALEIGAAPEASLRAAGELMYFYTEAEKPDRVWPVWEAVQQMEEMASWEGLDSLAKLRRGMEQILPVDTVELLARKYYPTMQSVRGGRFEIGETGSMDWIGEKIDSIIVTLSDFELGKTELTVHQYFLYTEKEKKSMTRAPSWGLLGNNPLVNVNWWEALAYANWLSEAQGLSPVYTFPAGYEDSVQVNWEANGYRLPTEAEWEYAAGGGSLARTNGKRRYIYSGSDSLELVGWFYENAQNRTQPVGRLQPNALGLYDMSGNVWEWCWDWYGEYEIGPLEDPHGPYIGTHRVLRGGNWDRGTVFEAQVPYRGALYPAVPGSLYGFRLARAYSEAP